VTGGKRRYIRRLVDFLNQIACVWRGELLRAWKRATILRSGNSLRLEAVL